MSTQGEIRRNQIDRYVNGQLEGEELILFEQRMRDHVELAESVHVHRDVLTGIEAYFMQELKEELIKSDQQKPKRNIKTYLAIAASVLILVGAGVTYYLINTGGARNENQWMGYFEPYPNVIAPISRSSGSQPGEEAMQFYEMEQYAEAINKLNPLIEKNPDSIGLVFYRGVAYLGNHQPKQASTDFKTVIKADEKAFKEAAYWYLGISQLTLGNKAEAKNALQKVKEVGGALSHKAEEILQSIN